MYPKLKTDAMLLTVVSSEFHINTSTRLGKLIKIDNQVYNSITMCTFECFEKE